MAFKTIVVAVDAIAPSIAAAKYAICLAKLLGAKLAAVHVINEKVLSELLKSRVFVEVEARVYERDLEEQGRNLIERIRRMADSKQVAFEGIVMRGEPSAQVVKKAAELNADMLVMGELKEVFSTTDVFYDEGERIFRKAHCTTVVVKNREAVDALFKAL